jgi:ketosteroid isomerase-like protein
MSVSQGVNVKYSILWSAVLITGCAVDPTPEPAELATTTDAQALTGGALAKQVFERGLYLAELERSSQASHAGFAATVEALDAADAVYMEANHPIVRGAPAIAALLDADDPRHATRATFEPRRITVSADGQLGATFGGNTFTVTAADGSVTTRFGSYTTVWRFTSRGWRELAHVQNLIASAPPVPPAAFPLFDPAPPVLAPAAPATSAAEVAATDRAFAAACAIESSATVVPAFATADPAEAILGGVFYGLDRVTLAHANDFPISFAFLAFDPTDAASTFSGDLGFVDGEYAFPRVSDGQILFRGTYLTVYQRQPDHSWKWILANSSPEPVGAP